MGATLEETLQEADDLARARASVPQVPVGPKPQPAKASTPPKTPASASLGVGDTGEPNKLGWRRALEIGASFNPLMFGKGAPTPGELGDLAASAGAAIVRAPGQLLGGLSDSVADTNIFISHNIDKAFSRTPGATYQDLAGAAAKVPTQNPTLRLLLAAQMARPSGGSLADVASMKDTVGRVGFEDANQVATEGLAMIPGVFGGEAAVGVKALTKVMSPTNAERVGRLLVSSAKQGAVTGVAASADDLEGRAKNAALGFTANMLLEPILGAIIPHGKPARGTPEDAAKDALDRTFATTRTQDARAQALEAASKETPGGEPSQQAPTQEALPVGTRHTDAPQPPEGGTLDPSGTGASKPGPWDRIAEDANAALDRAGVTAEPIDPATMQVTPTGKIIVEPATKDALDAVGMGRAFESPIGAIDHPKAPVIFKEIGDDGSERVVGIMDKYDLDQFSLSAQAYAEGADSLDTEAGSHVGQWKLGNLGDSRDVGAFGRALADHLEGSPRPKSDEELYASAQRIADDTGLRPEDVIRLGTEWAGRTADLDEGQLAVRMVQARILADLEPHGQVAWSTLSPDDPSISAALDAVHNALLFASHVETGKTGLGRGLRAAGLPTEFPDAASYRANFGKQVDPPPLDPRTGMGLPRNHEELQAWFDLWGVAKASGDPEVMQAFLQGQTFPLKKWLTLRNSFANYFTASIVSAPRTFLRDIFGPSVVSGFNMIGRMTAGGMMAVNPLLSASARREAWAASWSAPRAYFMAMTHMADALKFSGETIGQGFRKGASAADSYSDPFGAHLGNTHGVLGGHNPLDFSTQGVPRVLMKSAQDAGTFGGTVPYMLANLINKFPQAVHSLHGGANELGQRLSYLGEVYHAAYQEASKLGYEGKQFDNWVRDEVLKSTDETGKFTDAAAFDASERTAFIRRPTEDDPYALRKATQWRNELVKAIPEMRLIVPIFTVPANALGETLRRIPGLGFVFKVSGAELRGELGVPAQVDAYGRQLTGGAVLGMGWMMAHSGNLTAGGPHDPQDRAVWLTTHQPYSIRLGGNWYGYSKADLLGPLLGIVAGSYDHTVYHSPDKPEGASAAVAALAEYFKDQAALQTLSQIMNIGSAPGSSEAQITRLLGATAGGFIPNFIEQLGRETTDDYLRVKRTPWDYIKDRLPGASQTLDPLRNLMGEAVHKPSSPGFNTLPANISPVTTYDTDPVLDEIGRLYENTGYAPGALSPAASGAAHFDLRDVKLENGFSLYDAIMKNRQSSVIDGVTMRQALKDLIDSPEYGEAQDGSGKSISEDGDNEKTRGGMIAKVFSAYTKAARQDAAKASPLAARYLAVAKAKDAASVPLKAHTADEIAKNPGLLSALGINIEDYEAKVRGE